MIQQNVLSNNIHIVKSGEFIFEIKKSLKDIRHYFDFYNFNSFNKGLEEELLKTNAQFIKYYNVKLLFKIKILKEKNIIGLPDILYNNYTIGSIKCVSQKGETLFVDSKVSFYSNSSFSTPALLLLKIQRSTSIVTLRNFKLCSLIG